MNKFDVGERVLIVREVLDSGEFLGREGQVKAIVYREDYGEFDYNLEFYDGNWWVIESALDRIIVVEEDENYPDICEWE